MLDPFVMSFMCGILVSNVVIRMYLLLKIEGFHQSY